MIERLEELESEVGKIQKEVEEPHVKRILADVRHSLAQAVIELVIEGAKAREGRNYCSTV